MIVSSVIYHPNRVKYKLNCIDYLVCTFLVDNSFLISHTLIPLTIEQIAAAIGITTKKINKRILKLIERGFVVEDGNGYCITGRFNPQFD